MNGRFCIGIYTAVPPMEVTKRLTVDTGFDAPDPPLTAEEVASIAHAAKLALGRVLQRRAAARLTPAVKPEPPIDRADLETRPESSLPLSDRQLAVLAHVKNQKKGHVYDTTFCDVDGVRVRRATWNVLERGGYIRDTYPETVGVDITEKGLAELAKAESSTNSHA